MNEITAAKSNTTDRYFDNVILVFRILPWTTSQQLNIIPVSSSTHNPGFIFAIFCCHFHIQDMRQIYSVIGLWLWNSLSLDAWNSSSLQTIQMSPSFLRWHLENINLYFKLKIIKIKNNQNVIQDFKIIVSLIG